MPSRYVLDAVKEGLFQRRRELHEDERPVALLSSIMVNSSRDPKKSKPVNFQSLCFYEDGADANLPDSKYGSAAMELINRKEFPSWGLFIYKDLQKVNSRIIPDKLALRSLDAIILAPRIERGLVYGMLIAREPVSKQWIEMTDDNGDTFLVLMPRINTKAVAQEDVELTIRPSKSI